MREIDFRRRWAPSRLPKVFSFFNTLCPDVLVFLDNVEEQTRREATASSIRYEADHTFKGGGLADIRGSPVGQPKTTAALPSIDAGLAVPDDAML
jgi:hypothetical protein